MVTGAIMKVISNLLRKITEDIDCGNSNLTEEEATEVVEIIRKYTDRKERISKYEACRYLNVSRATFDNYIRAGKLPKGKKQAGFKELSWYKKDLDEFIESCRNHSINNIEIAYSC